MVTKNTTPMTPSQEFKLNAATTWVPATLVFTFIGFAIWGTWQFSAERSAIYQRFGDQDGRIERVNESIRSLAEAVRGLNENLGRPNTVNVTRHQLLIDCLRSQILNPSWKCLYNEPGWRTEIE